MIKTREFSRWILGPKEPVQVSDPWTYTLDQRTSLLLPNECSHRYAVIGANPEIVLRRCY